MVMRIEREVRMRLINGVIILATACAFVGCGEAKAHTDVDLPTMQCSMCKKTIETALADVQGITKAEVDMEKKVAHITYKASVIDLATIEKTIATVGYQANEMPADPEAYSDLDKCCKLPSSN